MKFIPNLIKLYNSEVWSKKSVIAFSSPAFPISFVSALVESLESVVPYTITRVDMLQQDFAAVKSSLETSFLGQQCIYYLGDIDMLPAKKKEAWNTYIASYQGPHCIIVHSSKLESKLPKQKQIVLPEWIDQKEHMHLVELLWDKQQQARGKLLSEHAFKACGRMTLDQAYLLTQYSILLGGNIKDFLEAWLPLIIPSQNSLYDISSALLSGKRDEFIRQYQSVQEVYPLPFWVSYWSEQLFRAIYYIEYKKNNMHQDSKQIGYRLPFTFLQSGWRSASSERLKKGYQALYQIDYTFKNGGSEQLLDNFYFQMLK